MKCMITLFLVYLFCINLLAQWIQTNYPVGGQITGIASYEDKLLVVNNFQSIYYSTDSGYTWNTLNEGITGNPRVQDIARKDRDIFIGTYIEGVYRFSHDDTSWIQINNGLTNKHVYALTTESNYLFAGTESGGVFVSGDQGSSWSFAGLSGETILDLSSDGENVFAGTAGSGVFVSTNHGSSWNDINNGLPNLLYILSIESNNNYLFAGTAYNGIFISYDGGANWVERNSGYYAADAWCFVFLASNILVGGSAGVFMSKDNGLNWIPISDGLTDYFILSLYVYGDYVYAGSASDGILYRRASNEILTNLDNKSKLQAIEFRLEQNYPNPFNPSTIIRYTIPASTLNPFSKGEGTFVQLKVYDVLGNEVATLVNEEKRAGSYEVEFNVAHESVRAMTSGVYFYQLKAGEFIQTKKMILLK